MREQENRGDKLTGSEIVIQNPVLRWLDNFWYHYKWHTIIAAFFIFVALICFVQCAEKTDGDMTVAIAGDAPMTNAEREGVMKVFGAIAPKGEDDASRTVLLSSFLVYTEEELKALYTDEDGRYSAAGFNNAKQTNLNNINEFASYIKTGDSAVWFVSEYLFDYQNLDKLAVPLTELYDTLPAGAVKDGIGAGYAIRLGDTALYQYYDALKVLPEDMLIVMSRQFIMGGTSNAQTYQMYTDFYRAIVEFEAP